MWWISVRQNIGDDHRHAETPQVFEGPPKLTTRSRITPRTLSEFCSATEGSTALVLVHGYASPIESVGASYAAIEARTMDMYDHVVGFTWPSVHVVAQWWKAKRNAEQVDQAFVRVARSLRVAHLDVMTHSLGARVVLSGLTELPRKQPTFRNAWLTAAAVDNEALEKGEELHEATAQIGRVFVLHSRRDNVLRTAYLGGNGDRALGLHGPEEIEATRANVHAINCKRVVGSHSGYRSAAKVFGFMRTVVLGGDVTRRVLL